MAILSTLRSQALRLYCLFSGKPPLPSESSVSLTELNDDCLLLILEHFSISQLFSLRSISSHLYFLIQRYCLSRCRTLIYRYDKEKDTVQMYFTNEQHVYSNYCLLKELNKKNCTFIPILEEKPVLLRLHTMPFSLPHLLSGLTCLTWTHFLADQVQLPTDEQIVVNRLLVAYLRSFWSESLVSLHLQLNVPSKPQANHAYFCQLGQLKQLEHLFLEFTQFVPQEASSGALLPDSMPILSQLVCFSLHLYGGSNTAKLLNQLGPNLAFLSLFEVACSVQDYASFLRGKPTYSRTFKSIEVKLHNTYDYQVFAVTAECLTSLERFFGIFIAPTDLLITFTAISRLSKLRQFINLRLEVDQLRDLKMRYPRPGALPRLPLLFSAVISIVNVNPSTLQPEELFDDLLPLLQEVFCGLEELGISLQTPLGKFNTALSERFKNRALKLFPKLRFCHAFYKI